jgi:hypothetical protein
MRFTYNGRVVVAQTNGSIKMMDDKEVKIKEDKVEANLRKFEVKTYREFLAKMAEQTSDKVEKAYYCMMAEGHLLVAASENNKDLNVVAFYKPESAEITALVTKMLEVKDGSGRVVIGNTANDFNFIAPKTILSVVFTAASIRSRGEALYREFKIKSKNGKVRDIVAPHDEIKVELQRLNGVFQHIFDKINADFQVAYKKGKSIADNAEIHRNNKFVYNVDLKDFYPSCKKDLVDRYVNFFFKNNFNGDVTKELFLDIVLKNGGLFIGSPISGTLANVIISKPVNYMKNIARKFGMEFSVYADDMTFSSDRFISRKLVEGAFNLAFSKYNLDSYFKLNDKKFHGMSNNRRRVTGVTINHDDEPTVARGFYRDLRVKIHKLSLGETTGINIQKLRGRIAFASMVDESGKIYRLLSKFESTVSQFKLASDEKMAELKQKNGGK